MLRRFQQNRTFKNNLQLGIFTAITAGMVNVASLVLFYSFTSNVTGHFAILAEEIANGNWFQIAVVLFWVGLFFSGSFLSNFIIINSTKKTAFFSHSIPMILEILGFIVVGVYGNYFYTETLTETEFLVAILLFSMGLQNGLTASITNFAVKTTHVTGLTTDLAIHVSMLTQKKYRKNEQIVEKTKLMSAILFSYVVGGVISGLVLHYFKFNVFFVVSGIMIVIICWDYYKSYAPYLKYRKRRTRHLKNTVTKVVSTLNEGIVTKSSKRQTNEC